ncbi:MULTISPECIES: ribosomal protection-like ABC-F family protein [Fusobacterium]|jgi:lincosamide and streptogramin A transport system ATP-binding/permease protein|uniref:ribosomal protection-like ABC-F family protein n=1 Tax=Fusobacterium TaxID=848 RepID=UPI000E9A8734|nr:MULTISPECIES: ABC-F type ribosomal protection protein [Fusobacterium]HBJ79051.1 ABC-F type ribosomal protection protein [Fusobacterium sp.]
MSLINISNLTFAYDGSADNIFENVSFQIDTDWKLGFTGRNGRGKTTFLNLLLGKYEYKGSISGGVIFEYFPFEIKDKTLKTIEIIDSLNYDYQMWELEREMSLLDISEDVLYREFNTLSNGEQTKILLAVLFLKENRFLLIDEPTNHLDIEGREIVAEYLKSKKGFILVSHDRRFLDNCIDHILSINKANIEIQKGNFSSWQVNKEMQDNSEIAKNYKLKKDIKRLEQAAKRTSEWSDKKEEKKSKKSYGGRAPAMIDKGFVGAKAAKMMKKSKNLEARQNSALEEKTKLLKNIEISESLKIKPEEYHSNRMVTLDKISIFYGEKEVCKDVSFTIKKGDRIALRGKNGSGKSTILKLILGEDLKYTGNLYRGSRMKISYVSQETSFLKGKLSDFAKNNNIDESLFRAILRKMDFSREQFDKDLSSYSGGQKKKVLIAKSLCERAHLYVWDEPLNFIDVLSRIQIEELILEFHPTIIFVEHDMVFSETIANKIIKL